MREWYQCECGATLQNYLDKQGANTCDCCNTQVERLEVCPHCSYIHQHAEKTHLKAGFNGIKEGDADDKDCFKCVRCNKEFGQKNE
jgi:hypothetical protein